MEGEYGHRAMSTSKGQKYLPILFYPLLAQKEKKLLSRTEIHLLSLRCCSHLSLTVWIGYSAFITVSFMGRMDLASRGKPLSTQKKI